MSEHIGRHKECAACDEIRATEEHRGQHWECQPCFAIKVGSVQFAGAGERAIDVRQRDRQWNVDGEAYWRLKKEGIQPNNVDGSAKLEQCMTHPLEAAMGGNLFPWEKKALAREGMN